MPFFKALGDIVAYVFVGGLILGLVRWILPNFITGTTGTDHIMQYLLPVVLLVSVAILCAMAFKKRKQQGGQ